MTDILNNIECFVDYVRSLRGDEKGEAQVFCDRLFQAFNHAGYKEAGAELEYRVKAKGKTTKFADLLWRPRLLLEMKKRGEKVETAQKFILQCVVALFAEDIDLLPSDWLPNNSTKVVGSEDFYVLGILTSNLHRQWVKAQSSTLKADTRYTHKTCFETFPFPQNCPEKIKTEIRAATQAIHDYRTEQMERKQWGITQLYNQFFAEPASQLAKLHAQLDQLVCKAYGIKANDDVLKFLLELNFEVANAES